MLRSLKGPSELPSVCPCISVFLQGPLGSKPSGLSAREAWCFPPLSLRAQHSLPVWLLPPHSAWQAPPHPQRCRQQANAWDTSANAGVRCLGSSHMPYCNPSSKCKLVQGCAHVWVLSFLLFVLPVPGTLPDINRCSINVG